MMMIWGTSSVMKGSRSSVRKCHGFGMCSLNAKLVWINIMLEIISLALRSLSRIIKVVNFTIRLFICDRKALLKVKDINFL